jgi:hypothetical protein
MHPLLADPWIASKIDAVVKRYSHIWTEEQRVAFREAMAETLATNPHATRLLRRAHPDGVNQSGEARVVDDATDEAAKASKTDRTA